MEKNEWRGNKGEWGEAFTLLWFLAGNRLYNANIHGEKLLNEPNVVLAVLRTETSGAKNIFVIHEHDVVVKKDGVVIGTFDKSIFKEAACSLFERIQKQGPPASHHEQELLKRIGCESLKAGSNEKADLIAIVRDGFLASTVPRLYSIKTLIGSKPSLANASGHSYIDYELKNFDRLNAEDCEIIAESAKSKIVEKTQYILGVCNSPTPHIRSDIFKRNLLRCHWEAPEIIGMAFIYGQLNRGKYVIDSIADLVQRNPLAIEKDDYGDAIRQYLLGTVLKLTPGKPWRGPVQVDGYLLATDDGEVLSYQVSQLREFADYLLLHASWDTPSTDRHSDTGAIVQREDGAWIYTLNCCVRYNKKEYSGKNKRVARIEESYERDALIRSLVQELHESEGSDCAAFS